MVEDRLAQRRRLKRVAGASCVLADLVSVNRDQIESGMFVLVCRGLRKTARLGRVADPAAREDAQDVDSAQPCASLHVRLKIEATVAIMVQRVHLLTFDHGVSDVENKQHACSIWILLRGCSLRGKVLLEKVPLQVCVALIG